jgi:2,3-bisphosphoglycerate-dependent phosphoglycerate mutase
MTEQHAVLHLVRHGESEWNRAGLVQGQSPHAGPLTGAGRAEAERSARLIAWRHPRAARIISSDLPRARETAEIIAGVLGLPVEHDPELREQHLGDLEGRRFTDPDGAGTVQDAVLALWQHPHRRPGDGESIAALYARVRGALTRHAAARSGGELILVTHGGPVRVATTTADPFRCQPVPREPVANASITTLPAPPAVPDAIAASCLCRD